MCVYLRVETIVLLYYTNVMLTNEEKVVSWMKYCIKFVTVSMYPHCIIIIWSYIENWCHTLTCINSPALEV